MNSAYKAVGVGYATASGAQYSGYWYVVVSWRVASVVTFVIRTQDFGGATCPAQTTPIYGGSHIFQNSGKTKFLANYYGTAPTSSSIVIDGTTVAMTLDIGSAGQGNFFSGLFRCTFL